MDGCEILHQLICGLSMFIPLFVGFQPSKVVQDFATIHSMSSPKHVIYIINYIYIYFFYIHTQSPFWYGIFYFGLVTLRLYPAITFYTSHLLNVPRNLCATLPKIGQGFRRRPSAASQSPTPSAKSWRGVLEKFLGWMII